MIRLHLKLKRELSFSILLMRDNNGYKKNNMNMKKGKKKCLREKLGIVADSIKIADGIVHLIKVVLSWLA